MEKDKEAPDDFTDNHGNLAWRSEMNVKQLLGAIVAMIVRIALAAAVIIVVFKLAVGAYNFGYQVFADIPVSEGEGRTVSVVVSENQSVKDVAKVLEQKGLITDANVFYVQERLSEYKDQMKSGTYELSTAMTSEEMLRILCQTTEDAEE